MRLVKTRDQAIYDKLVRLAGGDARIVSQVVESSDNSEPMDLLQIVEQIKQRRGESMNDQRAEALRLAKEAKFIQEYSGRLVCHLPDVERLIALARASAAPQEPEPDPSDELAWYKWAHKELGRRNTKLAEENFQYWRKGLDAAPQPQAAPQEPRVREIVREEIARSETERGDRIFPGVHK